MEGWGSGKIFLFVGQFGNQIGTKLLTSLNASRYSDLLLNGCSFISVDTEHKAANDMKLFSRLAQTCIVDKRGRGANWAMGYAYQSEKDCIMSGKETVLRAIRRSVEKLDYNLPEIVVIHSLIGGTGGGFTCSIVEGIKEEFPRILVTSVTTSPFVSGESPLQHYNELLTLAWLQRYTDFVLIFHNDEVMNQLMKTARKPGFGQVTLDEINDYICYHIMDMFHPFALLPQEARPKVGKKTTLKKRAGTHSKYDVDQKADKKSTKGPFTRGTELETETGNIAILGSHMVSQFGTMELSDTFNKKNGRGKTCLSSDFLPAGCTENRMEAAIEDNENTGFFGKGSPSDATDNVFKQLVVNESMKFVTCKQRHSKKFTTEYKPLLNSIISDLPRHSCDGNRYKTIAVLLSGRGEYAKVIKYEESEIAKLMESRLFFGPGFDGSLNIHASCLPLPGYNAPLSLSVYANTNQTADFIEHVLYKSSMLYEKSAYLHWFHKFGITKDHFEDAMRVLTRVVREYSGL